MAWSGTLSPADFVGQEEAQRYAQSVVRGVSDCCGAMVYQLRYEGSGQAVMFNGQMQRINACPMCGKVLTEFEPQADVTKRYYSEVAA